MIRDDPKPATEAKGSGFPLSALRYKGLVAELFLVNGKDRTAVGENVDGFAHRIETGEADSGWIRSKWVKSRVRIQQPGKTMGCSE